MKAEEIMTKDVVTIRGSATVVEAVELMKDRNCGLWLWKLARKMTPMVW